MRLTYDFYKSILLIHRNLTKEIFLEKAGANGGQALDMFSKMFDSITSELINIDREYEKYYSFEYNSIEEFLYKKYNLKEDFIYELMKEREQNSNCGLYRTDDMSYGDDAIMQFTFSDTMNNRVMNILMLKS